MIEAGLPSIQRQLEEISHSASKEFALEKALEKMKGEWSNVVFEFKPWRFVQICIIFTIWLVNYAILLNKFDHLGTRNTIHFNQ